MVPLDPGKLALTPTAIPAVKHRCKANRPRPKRGRKFLKGPVPMTWLNTAARQPGKALHVGIALWHLAGLQRSRTVTLSATVLRELGVARTSGYRALAALEAAGLVAVERHPGRCPVVALLAVKSDDVTD